MHVLRFTPRGSKKRPFFHLVATDRRNPLTGRVSEILGFYNPKSKELRLNLEAIDQRLKNGDQPSNDAAAMIKKARRSAAPVQPGEVAKL